MVGNRCARVWCVSGRCGRERGVLSDAETRVEGRVGRTASMQVWSSLACLPPPVDAIGTLPEPPNKHQAPSEVKPRPRSAASNARGPHCRASLPCAVCPSAKPQFDTLHTAGGTLHARSAPACLPQAPTRRTPSSSQSPSPRHARIISCRTKSKSRSRSDRSPGPGRS